MDFDCFKAHSFSASGTRIVSDKVFIGCESSTVLFLFFWSDRVDNSGLDNSTAFENMLLVDEEDGVCAFDALFEALGKAAEFVYA